MNVNYKGKNVKLPDFINVGANKCGTTSLFHYMRQHPQVFMPACKEPRFFFFNEQHPQNMFRDPIKDTVTAIWRFDDYVDLFKMAKDGQIMGEASPQYLHTYDTTIKNIISIYGKSYKKLKIIVILRNPVDRAFSHYLFCRKIGREKNPSFEHAIKLKTLSSNTNKGISVYLENGMYYRMVKAYVEVFPDLKIYFFEDLKEIDKTLKSLFLYLDVDPNLEINTNIMVNPSGVPKNEMVVSLINRVNYSLKSMGIVPNKYRLHLIGLRDFLYKKFLYKPKMDNSTRKLLVNYYKEDIMSLQKLTNRDLTHWLR